MSICWSGPPAPDSLAEALRAAGLEVAASPPGADDLCVVSTAGSRRVPTEPGCPWVWLSFPGVSERRRLEAVRSGAYDVVSLRDDGAAATLVARLRELAAPLPAIPPDRQLVLRSQAARAVAQQIARVAPTSMPVLFTGETGTGKEIMARLTHAWSARHAHPFVPINCAAIPNELMEAELFGYARGAFSGAVQRYDGQLMAAAGGTVFLDEIDETPPETQVKLLRVLEDRVVSRLGENAWHEVDFRLLAATNRDLTALVEAGLFGADLYERLAIVTIHLVPLRDRPEDLPDLARQFAERFAREHGRPLVAEIRADAVRALQAYRWPGNIRELRSVIYETLVYKRAGAEILPADLPKRVLEKAARRPEPVVDRSALARKIATRTMNLKSELLELQRLAAEEALARSAGNAAEAARLLGEVGRGMARDPGGTLRAMLRRLERSR